MAKKIGWAAFTGGCVDILEIFCMGTIQQVHSVCVYYSNIAGKKGGKDNPVDRAQVETNCTDKVNKSLRQL